MFIVVYHESNSPNSKFTTHPTREAAHNIAEQVLRSFKTSKVYVIDETTDIVEIATTPTVSINWSPNFSK
jgi:hypothetical protein